MIGDGHFSRVGRRPSGVDPKATAEAKLDLTAVADELAAAIRCQWQAEASVRRIGSPAPLSVRWVAADSSLVSAWGVLESLGASSPSGPSSSVNWATGPEKLAGRGGQLADVLGQVPTGRLVVLGGPGSGKTTLLIRLALDLLERRASGGPVPLLVSVGSWDPARQDFYNWLSARLYTDYPALTSPAPPELPGKRA